MKYGRNIFFVFSVLYSSLNVSFSHASSIDSLKQLFNQCKIDTTKVKLLNGLSSKYRDIGNFDSAVFFADASIRLAISLDYKKGIAKAYNNAGVASYYLGNYKNALKNYFASYKIYERLANADKANYNKDYADIYNNIGMVYQALNDNKNALEYHKKALHIRESLENNSDLADSYNNIGIVYSQTGEYEKASENYKKALALKLELKNEKSIAQTYNNIGSNTLRLGILLKETGNNVGANSYFKKALDNYMAVLKIQEKIEDKQSIAMSYANIGGAYYYLQNYSASEKWFLRGLDLSKAMCERYLLKEIYSGLSEVNFKTGSYKDAFFYLQQSNQYEDSILNEETAKSITEMQTKYETEKKNKQINLLEKEKKIQSLELSKQQEQAAKDRVTRNSGIVVFFLLVILAWTIYSRHRLKEKTMQVQQNAELEMKALRAQMNPHFIFNSLASIQQFIYSQKSDAANEYLSRFSKLIRMIFNHSGEKNISLTDDLEALKLYMDLEQLRLDGKFVYHFHIESDIEAEEIEIPPLIIQPYVENAIWHGISQLEGEGKIDILIKMNCLGKSNILMCIVKDNGIGREQSEKNKKQKNSQHKSQGMSITNERLELLNSMYGNKNSVEIIDLYSENKEPSGTEVRIFIPLKNLNQC